MAFSTTVAALLGEVQEHLLQTNDAGVTWVGWTQAEVLSYLNTRFKRFLLETGILRTRFTTSTSTALNALPSDAQEVRRVAWNGVSLRPTDHLQLDLGRVGWQVETGTPDTYLTEVFGTTQNIFLIPSPSGSGTLEVHYVPDPATFVIGSTVPIPNFLAFYLKWGLLATLLTREGFLNDPERATYCEQRYQEGVDLTKILLGAVT